MASRFALLVKHLHILPTFLADALAVAFAVFLAKLAESHATGQTNLSIDFGDCKSASVAGLAMTEALTYHLLMLDTDVLETSLAFIAFGLIPGPIIADNRV